MTSSSFELDVDVGSTLDVNDRLEEHQRILDAYKVLEQYHADDIGEQLLESIQRNMDYLERRLARLDKEVDESMQSQYRPKSVNRD